MKRQNYVYGVFCADGYVCTKAIADDEATDTSKIRGAAALKHYDTVCKRGPHRLEKLGVTNGKFAAKGSR